EAQAKMDTPDAQSAITRYVTAMARVRNTLDQTLPRWDVVVSSAENPNAARSTQLALENLRGKLDGDLDQLELELGVKPESMSGQKLPQTPTEKRNIPEQRILNIQEYLSST